MSPEIALIMALVVGLLCVLPGDPNRKQWDYFPSIFIGASLIISLAILAIENLPLSLAHNQAHGAVASLSRPGMLHAQHDHP